MRGAKPVFADVDPVSQNITADSVEPLITKNTRVIICVHLAGWSCDMDGIMNLAKSNNLKVIEDCAQAHGAKYKGTPVGGIGHIGAWSFCQDKIMTTGGEGGMVTTNDAHLWSLMWSYKDHGKSWDAVYNRKHPPGYRWLHESFGTNYRLTEMQSAIGRLQIKKMPQWHKRRTENAQQILAACSQFPELFHIPMPPEHIEHAWYKCYVFIHPDRLKNGWNRDRMIEEINRNNVPCFAGSCSEVYLEKAFDNSGFRPAKSLPGARRLGETSLMFLVHPTLTDEEMAKSCEVIRTIALQAKC